MQIGPPLWLLSGCLSCFGTFVNSYHQSRRVPQQQRGLLWKHNWLLSLLVPAGEPISTRWSEGLKREIKRSRVGLTQQLVVSLVHSWTAVARVDPTPHMQSHGAHDDYFAASPESGGGLKAARQWTQCT